MSTFTVISYDIGQLLALSQLIVDFGLVILIWMVQLIVYPSFLYYDFKNLVDWHQKYTQKITIIVAPLMFLQLGLATYNVFHQQNIANIITLFIVVLLWIFTFTSFVPLHSKISEGKHNRKILETLVTRNWGRTFLWSALFIFDVYNNAKELIEIQL